MGDKSTTKLNPVASEELKNSLFYKNSIILVQAWLVL